MEPPLRPSIQGQKNENPSSNLHRNSALNAAAAFVQSTLRTLQTDNAPPALRCTNSSPSVHCTDFTAPRMYRNWIQFAGCEPKEWPEKPAKISAESQILPAGLRKRGSEPPTDSGVQSLTGNAGKLLEKARQAGGSEIRSAAPRESRFLAVQTPMPSDSPGEGPLESVNKSAVLLSPSSYMASGEGERKPSVDAKFSRKKDDTLGTRIQLRSTAILKFLVDESYASERRIRETFGNTPDISKTLRMLVKQHRVRRFGVGGRRSPFVYMAITSPGLSELEKLNRANANGIM